MANDKLRDRARLGGFTLDGVGDVGYGNLQVDPDEGLRLLRAFSRLTDQGQRERLIELAEKLARSSAH